jgi:hypothetical protein
MSDIPANLDLSWVVRTLRAVQAEQTALRSMIEPLPARFSALEARFNAIEARIAGVEGSLSAIGLGVQEQGRKLDELIDVLRPKQG